MFNLIFLIIAVPVVILESFIVINAEKKIFDNEPAYIIGWRKKKRAVLSDGRLKPAYWNARKLEFWYWLPILFFLSAAILIEIDGHWDLLAIGTGLAILILIFLLQGIRWTDFNKLKNRLKIELDRDYNTVVKLDNDLRQKKRFRAKFGLMPAASVCLAIASFKEGISVIGIVAAAFAAYNLVHLIKFYINKEKKS